MSSYVWTIKWDGLTDEEKMKKIDRVLSLETRNSVTKNDLVVMMRFLRDKQK